MMKRAWMIYGAYGFTGRLIAEEAVRQGHRPLLAGRSPRKLAEVADELGLEWIALNLEHHDLLVAALREIDLVLHAAGPYAATCAPMVRACLEARADYVDLSGELASLRHIFAADAEARARGVALVPGCGFDVVPTDCLAAFLAARVVDPVHLEIAISSAVSPSLGTVLAALGQIRHGGWVRRDGRLHAQAIGRGARRVRFASGIRTVLPIPVGDLETAWRSTGIGNIITYLAVPRAAAAMAFIIGPLLRLLAALAAGSGIVRRIVARFARGPATEKLQAARAHIWVEASDAHGNCVEGWMETAEPYKFTATAAVMAAERLLEAGISGAFTPAQAFGPDFVMEVSGTKRTLSPMPEGERR